jgi:phosphate transport system substrate-binding protein
MRSTSARPVAPCCGLLLLGSILAVPTAAGAETIRVVGSETLAPIVAALGDAFEGSRPGTSFEIDARGSSTGPPALLSGQAKLAAMSRPMKEAEIAAFQRRYGREPVAKRIAMDAVVVFVNADNPLERLRLDQVDAVFSRTRRCGEKKPARTWGDLGLEGEWADREIQRFGRNAKSGTHEYFREVALCGGLFDSDVQERPGPDSVRLAVAEARYGIGYGSRAALRMEGVKALALARPGATRFAWPVAGDVGDGAYPLTRRLLLYYNEGTAGPVLREFLAFATSPAGQAIVEKLGYLPAADARADAER